MILRKVCSMHLLTQRLLAVLYLPSGLSIYSCCGCAWQMSADSETEAKAECAFDSHRCERFPIVSDSLQPGGKLRHCSYEESSESRVGVESPL